METRIKGVLSPKASGSITITENGNYDVVDVANAVVDVPQPTGSITINANGEHNVKEYESAIVDVKPSGTIEITANGEHDVSEYATANVNVVDEDGASYFQILQAVIDKDLFNSPFSSTTIERIPEKLNFENISRASSLFASCNNLKSVEAVLQSEKVTDCSNMFNSCKSLTFVNEINFPNSTNYNGCFNDCSSLEEVNIDTFGNVTDVESMFSGCVKIKSITLPTTKNVNKFGSMFYGCNELESIEGLDLLNATTLNNILGSWGLPKLKSIEIKNIKLALTLGWATLYGANITLESLIGVIQELIDTGSSKTLKLSSPSIQLLSNVYVKITSTDADENGNVKLPFEVCESTDEGAMLITNYVTQKNWAIGS